MNPLLLLALGAATVAVVATTSSSSSGGGGGRTFPPPKRTGRRVESYSPPTLRSTAPGGAPQRETAPEGLSWSEFSGKLDIGSIRKPTRDVMPGYDVVELARVYDGPGPVRLFVDAYIVDFNGAWSAIATVKNTMIAHAGGLAASGKLDETKPTEQAERIVRDFDVRADGLVEGTQTSERIEHNESDPPNNVYAFYGRDCHIGHISARDSLYHLDDCRGDFEERQGRPVLAYADNRVYDLNLEVRADGGVYLVARIMRLPARQTLSWRAYAAAQPR